MNSRNLLENCLRALDAIFNDSENKIDTTVFNASRICEIYGMLAAKGDSTPDRPHRVCRILEDGDSAIVTLDQLRALASERGKGNETKAGAETKGAKGPGITISSIRYRYTPDEIEALLNASGIEHSERMDYGKGYKWQITCIFNPEHEKPDSVVYLIPSDDGDGMFAAHKCSHDSCKGRDWKEFFQKLRVQHPDVSEEHFRHASGKERTFDDGGFFTDEHGNLRRKKVDNNGRESTQHLTNFYIESRHEESNFRP